MCGGTLLDFNYIPAGCLTLKMSWRKQNEYLKDNEMQWSTATAHSYC
jgi:hypothetical protein